MSKVKKNVVPAKGMPATLGEFQESIRWLLVNEHGMPELVVQEVMDGDLDYISNVFNECHAGSASCTNPVGEVAEQLVITPRNDGSWVKLEQDMIVLNLEGKVSTLLTLAVKSGLYGDTKAEAADALLRRGIEVALPVIKNLENH